MLYVYTREITRERDHATIHIGGNMPASLVSLAESREGSSLVVQADGHELQHALVIVSNNQVNDDNLASNRVAKFVGDEARKIILNW